MDAPVSSPAERPLVTRVRLRLSALAALVRAAGLTRPGPAAPLCAAALLTLAALGLAAGAWERPVAGVFIDPFGTVSAYGWPSWEGWEGAAPLSPRDRVVNVDGALPDEPLRLPPDDPRYPAALFDQILQAAQAAPSPLGPRRANTLTLILSDPDGAVRPAALAVAPMGLLPFAVLCLGFIAAGWLLLLPASLARLLRPESAAARSFAALGGLAALVLITSFDFHTTRRLTLIFLLAYALLPAALLQLGLAFPDGAGLRQRAPALSPVPALLAVVVPSAALIAWRLDLPFLPALHRLVGGAVLLLGAVLALQVVRYGGSARLRPPLRLALLTLSPVCLLGGLGLLDVVGGGGRWSPPLVLCLPPLAVLGGLGVLVALLRHGALCAPLPPPRGLLRHGLTLAAAVLLGLLGTLAAALSLRAPQHRALLVVLPPLLLVLAVPLTRSVERWLRERLFPSERPTVEQLSLWLRDLTSPAGIAEAVEGQVRRWLACDRALFLALPLPVLERARREDAQELAPSLPPSAPSLLDSLSGSLLAGPSSLHDANGEPLECRVLRRSARRAGLDGIGLLEALELYAGRVVRPALPLVSLAGSAPALRWARLLVPARYRDRLVGLLAVSGRPGGQPLTTDDETLLQLLSNQAAVALACASATEQVEALRKAQEAALRAEKETALGTVAAEIAHEIRTPINFLRLLLDSCQQWQQHGVPPEPGDLESGREEVERLERMAVNLRRMATPRVLAHRPVALRELCEHVALILRERLLGRDLEVAVAATLEVDGDRDALVQILVNLVNNALDACGGGLGRVGVECQEIGVAQSGGEERLQLTIWDSGPGFTQEVGRLFQPWFTTKKTGSGLGLPITRRLVRAHGWEIGASRRDGRTCFDIVIPGGDWRRRPLPLTDEGAFDSEPAAR